MYTGYLIKVNGVAVPNRYINVETYKTTPNARRELYNFYDGNHVKHVVYSPHTTTTIEFYTNGLRANAKSILLSFFPTSEGLNIEYYNDKNDTYETGTFRINDPQFERFKIRSNENIYKPINIILSED